MIKFKHDIIMQIYRFMMTAPSRLPLWKIIEICHLEDDYLSECEQIAEECAKGSLSSLDANYELRCANVREWYEEQIELIEEGIL